MKRKLMLIPLALLAFSIIMPVGAKPTWYVNIQAEITEFKFIGVTGDGIRFDVSFVGVAGGPNVKGTVMGVDHLLIDWSGIAHLNVYLTITDKDGDKISFHTTGLGVPKNPGQSNFEGASATVIDMSDYPTTGKYTGLVGNTFRSEGCLTDVSVDPPGGYIHVKAYWVNG